MQLGKSYLVYISSDGTDQGTMLKVDCQGDFSGDFQQSLSQIKLKDCTSTSKEDAGFLG